VAYPPYKFTGKEEDPETGLIYFGARYYDAAVGIWHGVDPLSYKYPNRSSFAYCANNPIIYKDPDGRDHIFYMVFQQGTKGANDIAKQAQSILNSNGVNLQVQVMYVGKNGFADGYKSKLDNTDALAFIGSEKFVENLAGQSIGQGWTDDRVGYVDMGAVSETYDRKSNQAGSKNKFIARTSIHEAVGHHFLGEGHTDLNDYESGTAPRYNGSYMFDKDNNFIPNIMTSGQNEVFSDKRTFDFVAPDLDIINQKIPQYQTTININGMKVNICNDNCISKDNFSKKID